MDSKKGKKCFPGAISFHWMKRVYQNKLLRLVGEVARSDGGVSRPQISVVQVHVDDIELLVELDFPEIGQFHLVGEAVAF